MAAPAPALTPPTETRLLINCRAGIRETFALRPDLKEVHVLPNGSHYFTVLPNELTEDMEVTTLSVGDAALEDEAAPATSQA